MDAPVPFLLQYLPLGIAALLIGYVLYRENKKLTEANKHEKVTSDEVVEAHKK